MKKMIIRLLIFWLFASYGHHDYAMQQALGCATVEKRVAQLYQHYKKNSYALEAYTFLEENSQECAQLQGVWGIANPGYLVSQVSQESSNPINARTLQYDAPSCGCARQKSNHLEPLNYEAMRQEVVACKQLSVLASKNPVSTPVRKTLPPITPYARYKALQDLAIQQERLERQGKAKPVLGWVCLYNANLLISEILLVGGTLKVRNGKARSCEKAIWEIPIISNHGPYALYVKTPGRIYRWKIDVFGKLFGNELALIQKKTEHGVDLKMTQLHEEGGVIYIVRHELNDSFDS